MKNPFAVKYPYPNLLCHLASSASIARHFNHFCKRSDLDQNQFKNSFLQIQTLSLFINDLLTLITADLMVNYLLSFLTISSNTPTKLIFHNLANLINDLLLMNKALKLL